MTRWSDAGTGEHLLVSVPGGRIAEIAGAGLPGTSPTDAALLMEVATTEAWSRQG